MYGNATHFACLKLLYHCSDIHIPSNVQNNRANNNLCICYVSSVTTLIPIDDFDEAAVLNIYMWETDYYSKILKLLYLIKEIILNSF